MKTANLIFILLIILTASLPAESPILFEDSWESGFWNALEHSGDSTGASPKGVAWMQSQMQGPHSGQVVQDIVRAGKHAMRFEYRQAEFKKTNTTKKAHQNGFKNPGNICERWYGFSVYFPKEGMKPDSKPEIVAQWHATPDFDEGETWHGCGPVLFMKLRNDTLSVGWKGTEKRVLCSCKSKEPDCGYGQLTGGSKSLGSPPKDQWIDYVFHVKFNPFGDGSLTVWQNSVKVIERNKIAVGYNDTKGVYFCIGIYKYQGKSDHENRVIYFDEIKIGNKNATYADVAHKLVEPEPKKVQ